MTPNRGRAVVTVAALLALEACGAPVRAKTHGYRAHVGVKGDGPERSFEIAVRGEDRRQELASGRILIWKGKERRSYELDPAAKTYVERPFTSLDEVLPGFPLVPGFSDREESARRGVVEYHRESDAVFAGHACWIWRFGDRPGEEASPSMTYWVAPDLDSLVVRLERETPKPDGARATVLMELTNVRVNASPSLFEVPESFLLVGSRRAPGA